MEEVNKGKHFLTKQKYLKEKLKNETNSGEAMKKKFRHGKKDNAMSEEERKKIVEHREQGRKRVYKHAVVSAEMRKQIVKNEDDNTGTEAMDSGLMAIDTGICQLSSSRYSSKMYEKQHARQLKDEIKAKNAGNEGSNPKSKEIQKSRMKKEMTEAAYRKQSKETANRFGSLSRKFVDNAQDLSGKFAEFIKEHPKELLIVAFILFIVLIIVTCLSSCSMLIGGMANSTVQTSYTAHDQTIIDVDNDYSVLEEELQKKVDEIEITYPGYDEYQYDLDEINHNSYQLAAILTILHEDYTKNEVQETLQSLFDAQYEFTVTEIVETRTRMETRTKWEARTRMVEKTGTRRVWDPAQRKFVTETYIYEEEEIYWIEVEYEVEVEYEYYILQTTLTNITMDTVIRDMGLTTDQMSRYEMLLATYGNKKHLFINDIYSVVNPGDYQDYDVPAEYLTDTQFGNILHEAEKYLGYPYVWGGSNPDTSFDCSGFVSYVINNCGNGWNVGRQTANGLLSNCTRVSAIDAKPGDLIFFKETYDVQGASHVGIYVGDGMMLHCGNPIQYTSVNNSYWTEHFYTYGRIN